MNEILVKHGDRAKLMAIFNCSYPTIRKALNGKSKSHKSLKIRQKALELDGVEIEAVKETSSNQ